MNSQRAHMGPYMVTKPEPKVPDVRDDPNSREGRLRALSNEAAKRAGASFMEALVFSYAMTVLQEARIWHAFRGNADALVSVKFNPTGQPKITVLYKDRDGIIVTVRSA